MKIGQVLAGAAEGGAYQELVTGIPPLPLSELHLGDSLGRPWSELFERVDEPGVAASLGQVHRARSREGEDLAVKIRYPDIGRAVEAEMRIAGLLPAAGPVRRWGFDLSGYKAMLRRNMSRELDYLSEAARQADFAARVPVPGLVVPRVHIGRCREGVLVQSWEEGDALETVVDWPLRDRLLVGRTLLQTLFVSLFGAGLVHGDPHPGNYRVRRSPSGAPEVVLFDFGCTVDVSETERTSLLALIVGCREGLDKDPLACFVAMGFDHSRLLPIAGELPALCRILFAPFLEERPFRLAEWRLGAATAELLGELKWWFRAAGPPRLLLLMRAFQGLVRQLEDLGVALPWWPLLTTALGEEAIASARRFTPQPLPGAGARSFAGLARLLKVSVAEGGVERVSLAFPASQVTQLESLIPPEVRDKMRQRGVELEAIVARARDSRFAPQELFCLEDGDKRHRVWLE